MQFQNKLRATKKSEHEQKLLGSLYLVEAGKGTKLTGKFFLRNALRLITKFRAKSPATAPRKNLTKSSAYLEEFTSFS